MRLSEAWLREYINPPVSTQELADQLAMAGLEVDSIEPVAPRFSGVVIGEIAAVRPHPNAERLSICEVSVGGDEPLQIVCGAPNVYPGMRAPTALIGAVLPGNLRIKPSKLRGEASQGMLCSAQELGLAESSEGLLELPADAPVGGDIRDFLDLEDAIIDLDLTPNRADCLSVEGVAREVALLNRLDWKPLAVAPVAIEHEAILPIVIEADEACPRYLGRLIKGIDPTAKTPLWMRERLRRSGIRSVGPHVDVTNYVLMELGQPLHAFDAAKLTGGIHVRAGQRGETLALLNDQAVEVDEDVLVIADDEGPLALAGIMGGKASAVTQRTADIFLECAFFSPAAIMGKARRFGLHTESSHRFERGVDPELQRRALEHATQLMLEIAGGKAGPIIEATHEMALPKPEAIRLRAERIKHLLGVDLAREEVAAIFNRLGMEVESQASGWKVTPPSFRFDIAIEVDLIEELARVYGYDRLPRRSLAMSSRLRGASEKRLDLDRVKDLLVDRGYQEAITYSFVDNQLQAKIAPEDEAIALKNPISSDLSVMRTTLWSGLLQAALRNVKRQQSRIRLFESGLKFLKEGQAIRQEKQLAGLAMGSVYPEQWGEESRPADFYDVKADIEALLSLTGNPKGFSFMAAAHPALHPGQTAQILTADRKQLGWVGMLHPRLEKEFGFDSSVFLFELDQALLLHRKIPAFEALSRFPQVRRDIAVLVAEEVSGGGLVECIYQVAPELIKDIAIFDVYRGPGVESGHKSIALGLILQHGAQTLTDVEVDAVVSEVLNRLAKEFGAKLRD